MASDDRHRHAARGGDVRRHVPGAVDHRISADHDDPLQRHRNALRAAVEEELQRRGKRIGTVSMKEMDEIWDAKKKSEI